jgi:hypothetical protein
MRKREALAVAARRLFSNYPALTSMVENLGMSASELQQLPSGAKTQPAQFDDCAAAADTLRTLIDASN